MKWLLSILESVPVLAKLFESWIELQKLKQARKDARFNEKTELREKKDSIKLEDLTTKEHNNKIKEEQKRAKGPLIGRFKRKRANNIKSDLEQGEESH